MAEKYKTAISLNSLASLNPHPGNHTASTLWADYVAPLLYLATGVIMISVGYHNYDVFLSCDNFNGVSSKKWKNKGGYDESEFVAFLVGTIFLPLGYVSMLIFAVQSFRNKMNVYLKLFLYYTLIGVTIACIDAAHRRADEILDCGIFCVGDSKTAPKTMKASDAFVGMMYLFASVLHLALLVFMVTAIHLKQLVPISWEGNSRGVVFARIQNFLEPFRRVIFGKAAAIFAAFVVFFPLMVACCMIMPTSYKSLKIASIRSYEIKKLTSTSGASWSFHKGAYLIMKLTPDILYYYGTFYLVLVAGALSWISPLVRRILHMRPKFLLSYCVGEFLMLIVGLALVAGEWAYVEHYLPSLQAKSRRSPEESAALAIGEVANVCMGLLTLPITRNSVFTILFGVSWEVLAKFHEVMGYLFFATAFAHTFLFWKVYKDSDAFPHDILGYPTKVHANNPSTPLISWVLLLASILVLIPSILPVIRRHYHELFYWGHHMVMPLFLAVLWHSPKSWYFIVVGLLLWIVDHAVRLTNCLGTEVKMTKLQVNSSKSLIHMAYHTRKEFTPELNLRHRHGEYCFINIPAISSLEWHPFTIASHPNDPETTHFIRSRGGKQWTGLLADLAEGSDEASVQNITVIVDGPYGADLSTKGYPQLVFVAGGVGITPFMSTLFDFAAVSNKDLEQTESSEPSQRVKLVWVLHEGADLEPFPDMLRALARSTNIQTCIFITKKGEDFLKVINYGDDVETKMAEGETSCISWHHGRPDLMLELKEFANMGEEALVVACGPPSLADACQAACGNAAFRRESFEY